MQGHQRACRLAFACAAVLGGGCTVPERQPDQEPIGWGEQSPFAPLDLPAPNAMRTGSGRPGPSYWQQEVDYAIEARVNTQTHVLTGTETITYRNNSPDALPFLWLKLDANRCDSTSIAALLDVPPLPFFGGVFDLGCRGGSGVTLERVTSGRRSLAHEVYGTLARVELPEPLVSGASVRLEIAWHWTIPEYGYARTDREGTLYQVAQWYPRVAVYDDVHGWNVEPFLGAGEFYQEYGDFRVALTVPDNFVATATGTIDNPGEVLTSVQRGRLARARASAEAVPVITEAEALEARDRVARGNKTWRFTALNVRDFAFAMAPDFRWDASTWNGVLIQTFYRPEATLWEEANRMSWVTIKHFSERLAPYPWPHATTIEGPNGGMEYPMLTFVPTSESREDLYWVLTHEFGHEWYPMLVNSNERLHPWMDEGFNTFIDIASVEEYFAGEPYANSIGLEPLQLYYEHALPGREQAVALPPDEQVDLFWAAYFKPAFMLHVLRLEVLGPERFDRAFSEYTKAWSFRHPYPADFFRFMEDAAGSNLDWFWRAWIYTTARLDQSVERVTTDPETGRAQVHLRSRGEMLMPIELSLAFADGSSETVRLPVQMWKFGPDYVYRVSTDRRLTGVEIDPRRVFPDDDRSNNVWSR